MNRENASRRDPRKDSFILSFIEPKAALIFNSLAAAALIFHGQIWNVIKMLANWPVHSLFFPVSLRVRINHILPCIIHMYLLPLLALTYCYLLPNNFKMLCNFSAIWKWRITLQGYQRFNTEANAFHSQICSHLLI